MNTGGQKYKILVIYRILMEQSDEENPLNATKLVKLLEEEGISAERKTIYKDIETLIEAGIDVVKSSRGYYVGSRAFELAELKLLVDAVSASKFISDKKSKALEKKIESLASKTDAKQLSRQVIVPDRVKTENEKIFYSIDNIYQAIDLDKQLSFQYEDWTIEKKKQLRHGGERYFVSPAFLIRNDENYYLVAYDEKIKEIRHYRVDKIVSSRVEDIDRGGLDQRRALVPEEYAKKHVGMYRVDDKEDTVVTVEIKKELIGVLLDRFGTDISIRDMEGGKLRARLPISVSPQFYGWLVGIGATIVAPAEEMEKFREYLENLLRD